MAELVVHIRFEGRSADVAFALLDVGDASSDAQVREALARHLEVPVRRLDGYVVERHENGNLTVRPEAVFG